MRDDPNGRLLARVDERVAGLVEDVNGLESRYEAHLRDVERHREEDQKERRRDRYTLIGIVVTLTGVVVSVISLLGRLPT